MGSLVVVVVQHDEPRTQRPTGSSPQATQGRPPAPLRDPSRVSHSRLENASRFPQLPQARRRRGTSRIPRQGTLLSSDPCRRAFRRFGGERCIECGGLLRAAWLLSLRLRRRAPRSPSNYRPVRVLLGSRGFETVTFSWHRLRCRERPTFREGMVVWCSLFQANPCNGGRFPSPKRLRLWRSCLRPIQAREWVARCERATFGRSHPVSRPRCSALGFRTPV